MHENQTIPVSELGVPDEVAVSKLAPDDIFRILAAKISRGGTLCVAVLLIGLLGVFVSLFYRSILGAVFGVVVYLAGKVGVMLVHQKLLYARRISLEPQLVYWAHPGRSSILGYTCILTLHSRTGQAVELATSREQAASVIAWLRQHNEGIRIGDYDDTPQSPNELNA